MPQEQLCEPCIQTGVVIPRFLPPQLAAYSALAPTPQYWLTRVIFLRGLGGIFAVAFSVALFQNKALIGDQVGPSFVPR